MANFSIQYSASASPIEELVSAVDNTKKVRMSHSGAAVEGVGGGIELACNTTATFIKYKKADSVTGSYVALSHSSLIGAFTDCHFIMIKIKESKTGVVGTPDLSIKIGTQEVSKLIGKGDVCILRPNSLNLSGASISSSGANALASVEILVGRD